MNQITHQQVEAKYPGALASLKSMFEAFFTEPGYRGTNTDATKAVNDTEFYDSEDGLSMEHKDEEMSHVYVDQVWSIG